MVMIKRARISNVYASLPTVRPIPRRSNLKIRAAQQGASPIHLVEELIRKQGKLPAETYCGDRAGQLER